MLQILTFCSLIYTSVFISGPQGPDLFPSRFIDGVSSSNNIAAGDLNHDGKDDLVLLQSTAAFETRLNDGNANFPPGVIYNSSAPNVSEILLVDVNHDGDLDCLLSASINSPNSTTFLDVRLGDGAGGFGSLASFDMGWGSFLSSGDLNSDGNADAALIKNVGGLYFYSVRYGDGTGSFGAPITVPAVTNPGNTLIADFNVDGVMDLATTGSDVNLTNGFAAFSYGDGLGNFAAPVIINMGTSVALCADADVNEDGMADFVGNYSANASVRILPALGGGTFGPMITIPTAPFSFRFLAGDANADQHVDFIHLASGTTRVILGNGNGTFGAQFATLGANQAHFGVLANANGDAIPDMLQIGFGFLPAPNNVALSVLLGTGNGNFGCITVAGSVENGVALGDINNDGNLDIVSTVGSGSLLQARLANHSLGFTAMPPVSAGFGPLTVRLGDFNRDGKLDAATLNIISQDITILRGDGAGGFVVTGSIPIASASQRGMRIVDVNADNRVDIIISDSTAGGLRVFLGDGAGNFGAGSLYTFPSGSNMNLYPGDVNLDGSVDFSVAHASGGWLRYNNGAGAFGTGAQYTTLSVSGTWLGDANGDGALDYLAHPSISSGGTIHIRFNDGTGGANGPLVLLTSQGATDHAALEDATGDGLADVVATGAVIRIFPGKVNIAGFGASQNYVGFGKQDLAMGDFNHDGRLDLATSGAQTNIFINRTAIPSGMQQYGAGTAGCSGIQGLTASGPAAIGNHNFYLICTGAPPLSLGVGVVSTGQDIPGTPIPGIGAILHIDLLGSSLFAILNMSSDHAGYCAERSTIPNDPQLIGMTVFAQTFFVWPQCPFAPPRSLSSSAALALTFQ